MTSSGSNPSNVLSATISLSSVFFWPTRSMCGIVLLSSCTISTGLLSGVGTLVLNDSSLSFHSCSCSVASSILAAAFDLSIIAFHLSVTSSSSGFSRSMTSCGFGASGGNLLIKLWLAAINSNTAKGSNTTINSNITHLTALLVSTWSVIPQSTASAAMYFTGPISASSVSIFFSSGCFSTINSSILP